MACLLCQRLEHALQHLRQVSLAWPVSPRGCNLVCSVPSPSAQLSATDCNMRCRISQCLGTSPCTCQPVCCLPACELLGRKQHAGHKVETRQATQAADLQLATQVPWSDHAERYFKHGPSSPCPSVLTCLSCCSDILLLSGMALACSMAELVKAEGLVKA